MTEETPGAVATCELCGRLARDAAALLTWSTTVERGRSLRFCDTCSRAHLRSMEGKLAPEHW